MDSVDQGMVVSIVDASNNQVVASDNSEHYDERLVNVDVYVSSSKNYFIKYEFFAKSVHIGTNNDIMSSGTHMGEVRCSKPFVI